MILNLKVLEKNVFLKLNILFSVVFFFFFCNEKNVAFGIRHRFESLLFESQHFKNCIYL